MHRRPRRASHDPDRDSPAAHWQLGGLSQPAALVDEQGRQIGHFIPSLEAMAEAACPYAAEELAANRAQKGRTLTCGNLEVHRPCQSRMNGLQSQFDDVLKQWRAGAVNDTAAAIQLLLVAGLHENPDDAVRHLMTSAPPRIVAAIEQVSREKLEVKVVEEISVFRRRRS